MLRKYGLDEGKAYVETCTLLEPNNFIPSWVSLFFIYILLFQEAGDEEIKEVSKALRGLRKKYDNVHEQTLAKENELEMIKKDVSKIKSMHQ